MVSACLPLCRPLVQKSSPLAFVRRIFGSQTSKGAMTDSVPNHPPEGWHTIEIRCAQEPKTMVDEFELGEIAEPHDGIAVVKSFSAC